MHDARTEDPHLLSVAASISNGVPVDWPDVHRAAEPEKTAVIEQLQLLEGLSRISRPVPAAWGPFPITGEIGRGSFGTVYAAVDPNLQRDVALKVIRPRDPGTSFDAGRALREARLLAQVNHPNVVRVYRAERIGQEVGLSMELIKGRTLNELVRLQGPYSANEAIVIGLDLCRALAAVHGVKLLHGDIKANNVMRAEGGRTVLMDFGAALAVEDGPVRFDDGLAGTPIYLAPEVFAGSKRTRASDIYSVGVLLYYLTTGSYPVEGRTREEIEEQHGRTPRKLLRDVRPDLPDAFIQAVDRALAEHPRDRYQTAGELERALERGLRPGAEPAPLPPFRWRLVVAGVALCALAVGSTVAYRLWPQAETLGNASSERTARTATPAAPVIDGTYRIDAALYREQDGVAVRLGTGTTIAPGDRLSLEVRASVPTYLYVVNEDDQGESYLLFPLPGQSVTNPLPAGQRHRIPGMQDGEQTFWQVTSPGGREHFVIFASPEPPSPAFARIFDELPGPTAGKPIRTHRLSIEAVGVLRGVGGLASKPARSDQPARLSSEFATPLTGSEEMARGVWVRQITLENPAR
jgi:hypothetical protein